MCHKINAMADKVFPSPISWIEVSANVLVDVKGVSLHRQELLHAQGPDAHLDARR